MKTKIEKILRSEFIGKKIKIVDAANKSLIGLEGEIIDETQQTLSIKTKKGTKKIIKKDMTFEIEKIKINGKIITKRPEDRMKIKVKQ